MPAHGAVNFELEAKKISEKHVNEIENILAKIFGDLALGMTNSRNNALVNTVLLLFFGLFVWSNILFG